MVTIIWKESKGTAKSRYKARREELIAERRSIERLARKIALKISGCVRADKAISLGSLRCKKSDECSESICLPNTALYAAGYRKSGTITAR
ncbi:hypothetical protein NIT42_000455 [Escherichia coli]|nr:hypothetical protein [Escherichia coli]